MIGAYTGTQIRAAEAPLLAAGLGPQLMQRAAFGLAAAILTELRSRSRPSYGCRLVVLAGTGNNGADALFAAVHLAQRGAGATAVLTGDRAHPQALAAFRHAGGRVFRLTDAEISGSDDLSARTGSGDELDAAAAARLCAAADVVVDGILGTGATGGLREPAAALVTALGSNVTAMGSNSVRPLVVACDLPSGVDAETGECAGPVLSADLSVSFGGTKAGLLIDPGANRAGAVRTVPIGLEEQLGQPFLRRLEARDLAQLWPAPESASHKYSRGVLGIVAGSAQYPGAAVLCAEAALATGTGMVRFLGPETVARLINVRAPEVVCSQGSVAENHVQAWLVGPGIGTDDKQLARAHNAINSGLPTVADASALPHLPEQLGPQVILTPHAGELAGLLQDRGVRVKQSQITASREECVRTAARLTGATVLLKGATTLVASPGGMLFSQAEGTSWLSTAGSGDALAGILGALLSTLAAQQELFEAAGIADSDHFAAIAAMAASIHGRAARLASSGGPMTSSHISMLIKRVFLSIHDRDASAT